MTLNAADLVVDDVPQLRQLVAAVSSEGVVAHPWRPKRVHLFCIQQVTKTARDSGFAAAPTAQSASCSGAKVLEKGHALAWVSADGRVGNTSTAHHSCQGSGTQ
jgi:hypothetical protein